MQYINRLTRPPSTICSRFIWPINSINTYESRKFEAEVHSYFVRPTFDGRHRITYFFAVLRKQRFSFSVLLSECFPVLKIIHLHLFKLRRCSFSLVLILSALAIMYP